MKYRHLIWDWNGTLLDDAWLCRDVMNHLLAARNMPELSEERYQAVFGFPVVDYYRRLGFDFERESFEIVGTEFIAEYEQRRGECSLQEGAFGVLEALQAAGVHQSVLSAYRETALRHAIEGFALNPFFEHIIGLDDHYAGGKQAQGLRLAGELNAPPGSLLLIGDTDHDAEVARAMGADCWLIPSGNHTADKLATTGARVVPRLDAVPGLLAL